MLSHLARTRAFKCLCALSLTVTHSHLCAGFLPPDAISCVINNKIHLNRILLCTKKSFIFLKIHNQVEFKHHMCPASPSLFLPDSPANTHNHAHSASTMRHYASLVVTLFSKSFLRPGCFLQTIPPPHPPLPFVLLAFFFSSPISRFKKPQSEFSKVVGELRHLSFEHGEPKPLQRWI